MNPSGIFFWTVAKTGRAYGKFKGYLKNTSTAKKIFDGFNVVSIGSDLVDMFTGTESTGLEASREYKTAEELELIEKEKEKRKTDKETPTITIDPDQRELQPEVITDYYKKFPNPVTHRENENNPNPVTNKSNENNSNPITNKEKNTLNKLVTKLLDQSLLSDDDNDQETAYLYDLYFINSIRETALKRWPTIRNYHNAYSFAGMLKEIKEESTYEEMVLILFYFRMV